MKRAFNISADLSEHNNGVLVIENQEEIRRILMALKFMDESGRLHPFKEGERTSSSTVLLREEPLSVVRFLHQAL